MIEVRKLTKSYLVNNKENLILKNVEFTLPSTGLYFIVGKSGSGKSTLLNILEGLDYPSKGSVYINDKNISEFNESEKESFYQKDIGILFQHFNLIEDLSVLENLKLTLKIKDIKDNSLIEEYLEKYNLTDRKNNLVYELSGGEKQRVALIRSLLNKPKIIFADEPTGALDELNSKILMNDLKELSKEALVLIVTHNLSLVNVYADGYIKIENKRVELINIKEEKDLKIEKEKKKSSSVKFYLSLINRNLKKNIFKNIFTSFSLIFSIFILLVSFSIKTSIRGYIDNIIYSYPNYNYFEVSKVYNTSVNDSHLEIIKKELPLKSDVLDLFKNKEISLLDNLSFFLSGGEVYLNDEKLENIAFYPTNLVSLNEVMINESFKETYLKEEINYQELIVKQNKTYEKYIKEAKENIEEEISFEISFNISSLSEEFNYLSTPTVYYNYNYLFDYLSALKAETISLISERFYTYLSLLKEAKVNEEITSFSYLIELKNIEDYDFIKDLIESDKLTELDLEINSNPYTIVSSFKTLSDTIFLSLNIFIVLILLTSLFLIFALAFFSFLEHKKESAILKVLGSKFSSICLIYVVEEVLLYSFSYLVSFVLSYFLKDFISSLIYKITSINLILSFDLNEVLLLYLILLVFVILASFIPLRVNKNIEIVKELKEE